MEPQENQTAGVPPEQTTTPVPTAPSANNNHLLMGILSYLGPLVIVPYLMAKDDAFVKFHIKQGLVLLGISVIIFVLNTSVLPWMLYPLTGLINLGVFVLSIVGIVNVINHKEAALPLVGDLAKKITI